MLSIARSLSLSLFLSCLAVLIGKAFDGNAGTVDGASCCSNRYCRIDHDYSKLTLHSLTLTHRLANIHRTNKNYEKAVEFFQRMYVRFSSVTVAAIPLTC
jgi:hypothetical protein